MKIKVYLFLAVFLLFSFSILSQQPFRVMFYNVENLFDLYDDPLTADDEFTPQGRRYWSPKRYYHKLRQIAKVITVAGEWDTPALVGLCEVENDSVLIHLINRTPLRQQQYRYCVAGTGDVRGIRNALLYQRDKFRLLGQSSCPVTIQGKNPRRTRDILHVWGEVITGDTLDVFVVHFPSRSEGEAETESRRIHATSLLRDVCDSLFVLRTSPYILIMGDFNDTPYNKSVSQYLKAMLTPEYYTANNLYNQIPYSDNYMVEGTHKFRGEWNQLDHLIISGNFFASGTFKYVPGSSCIMTNSFLLVPDKTGGGIRPKRTYHGFRYESGYSDHLPVIADFLLYLSD